MNNQWTSARRPNCHTPPEEDPMTYGPNKRSLNGFFFSVMEINVYPTQGISGSTNLDLLSPNCLRSILVGACQFRSTPAQARSHKRTDRYKHTHTQQLHPPTPLSLCLLFYLSLCPLDLSAGAGAAHACVRLDRDNKDVRLGVQNMRSLVVTVDKNKDPYTIGVFCQTIL